MAKRVPGTLGGRSLLDEHGQLWAEFELYAHEEAEAEQRAAARARARDRAR